MDKGKRYLLEGLNSDEKHENAKQLFPYFITIYLY